MMLSLLSLTFLSFLCNHGDAGSVGHIGRGKLVSDVMSGILYALEPLSGTIQYRLQRHHLAAVDNSSVRAFRLHLGPDVGALDMELSQDGVWKKDSLVVVRRGDEVEEIQHGAVDHRCFLSGPLTSHEGAATFNRCGRLSGLIHAGIYIYQVEEPEDNKLDHKIPNVKVTRKRANYQGTSDEEILDDKEKNFDEEEERLIHRLVKRQAETDTPTVEVGIVVDNGFADHMFEVMGNRSMASLTDWIIQKWNLIRSIYGNVRQTGVPLEIEVKKLEIWESNPSYYDRLGTRPETHILLTRFCEGNSPSPLDHLMLYTMFVHTSHSGMAFNGAICRDNRKCALVKSTTINVKKELHLFGHSLGLHHDHQLEPCTDPDHQGGFMGWNDNYRFLDCYRRRLKVTLRRSRAGCLYQENVRDPALN